MCVRAIVRCFKEPELKRQVAAHFRFECCCCRCCCYIFCYTLARAVSTVVVVHSTCFHFHSVYSVNAFLFQASFRAGFATALHHTLMRPNFTVFSLFFSFLIQIHAFFALFILLVLEMHCASKHMSASFSLVVRVCVICNLHTI